LDLDQLMSMNVSIYILFHLIWWCKMRLYIPFSYADRPHFLLTLPFIQQSNCYLELIFYLFIKGLLFEFRTYDFRHGGEHCLSTKTKIDSESCNFFFIFVHFFILHTTLQLGVPNAKWDYTVGRLRCKNSTNYMLVMSILRLKL
jgi:hypothetical protein